MSEPIFAIVNLKKDARNSAAKIFAVCLIFLFAMHPRAFADHVHHLWYNNSIWQDQDLTALTGGPGAPAFAAVVAFRTTPNNQLHIYYVDPANHAHQLYYNGKSWSDADLTLLTGGPAAEPYAIAGFAVGNLQYVFYISDPDFHVHELYYNNSIWQDQDVTSLVGGSQGEGPLLGFITTPNNQFHVYYTDVGTLDLHQLFFDGTSWSDQDLTTIMGGAVQCGGFWSAGFSVGNLQHIFCGGTGTPTVPLDLFHIYYNNSTWTYEDVSVESGFASQCCGGIAAFPGPCLKQANEFEVYAVPFYPSADFNHFFHTDGLWSDDDLTKRIGAPTDINSGQAVAFETTPNDQYHVYYAPNSEVYQVYFNGTAWSVEDLTGGNGNADHNAGMSGFAIGNLQHVFYMSNN